MIKINFVEHHINMKKKLLYISFGCLFIFSIITIYYTGFILDKHKYLYIKQLIYYGLFFLFILPMNKKHLRWCFRNIRIIYIVNNLLLIYVLFFANVINGSRSWIDIGIFSFQPSEFMKITLIIYLAHILNESSKDIIKVLKCLLIVFIPSILTFLEPDTGIVIAYVLVLLLMIFFSKIKLRWTILLVSTIFLLGGLIYYGVSIQSELIYTIFGNSMAYRLERLANFGGYQINNALIGLGSAGIRGHYPTKYVIYLIEAPTDFIFASILTYFGFGGGFLVILSFITIDYYLIKQARRTNFKEKALVIGGLAIFLYQQIENIYMNIGLTPITGITLPLVSYGGSSLLSYMILFRLIFITKD